MYIACGETELARVVFDEIRRPNVFLWNAMIRSYSWNGPADRAIELYHRMRECGVRPDKFTFPFVLKACSGLSVIGEGKAIHDHARSVGLDSDIYVSTALVDMYAKCGCLADCYDVFDKMPERDVVAWNAMIAGFSLSGFYEEMFDLVVGMQRDGKALNSSTVVALLPAIGQRKGLHHGKSIHGYSLRRGFNEGCVLVGTALLDMYGKCECLDYARRVFDLLDIKNEVTWSAMIGAFVFCNRMEEAIEMFDRMAFVENLNPTPTILGSVLRACSSLSNICRGKRIHGFSIKFGFDFNMVVGNSLISLYSKGGHIDEAIKFFDGMASRDTISYSAIISGCVQNGDAEEALSLFRKMQSYDIEPDIATMVNIIPACSQLAALQLGRSSHCYVIIRGFAFETPIVNALIDMYSKCGKVNLAREVFDRKEDKDIVSWNAMISGYGIHGHGLEAISMFLDLQKTALKPDYVTFICLLSACSHSGLVTEGKLWFHRMTQEFNIVPRMEHFICMVDMLGRGGLLDEAFDFTREMPFQPDVHVWGALLSACRIHGNIRLGVLVSEKIQNLGPEGTENFVLLSNLYSAAGKWDEAACVRIVQKYKGFKKSPGCSWIVVKGTVHGFVGGDRSHPQFVEIYKALENLLQKMKKLGYWADTSFVFQDVEEEEKEQALLCHSEKLAIAYGILNLGTEQPIFVTKNLRVCGDCHTAIKFITKVTNREITVRDANRFHHFKNGVCSCSDFW
ncbi:Pentatricopeptide repeat-containing protein [Acorus gramineus]|uniref:Pentatricopeptide repeat-containing protein n=1 Tax=Acorus gramineus TaxID=55184 RepID=A0AAV9AC53_ACOGR|nr:Pentatricopeptide repeat-containing protein [Acorus gramineus]